MIKIIAVLATVIGLVGCAKRVDDSKIQLTEEELAYIVSHPNISWALEENRPPYVFLDKNHPSGLAPQYIDLISKKTGIKFTAVVIHDFNSSIEALRTGRVDIVTSVRPTPEDAEFMGFTPPFAYQGGVFVFRSNVLPRSPLTTGILKDSAAKQYLQRRFPDMKLVETIDDEQSIALLQKGLIDGSVTDEATAKYLTKKGGIETRSAIINFDYPYSFAYRQTDTMLGTILTKAIISISPDEKDRINAKWLKEER